MLGVLGTNGDRNTISIRFLATLTGLDAEAAKVGDIDITRVATEVRRIVGLTGPYAWLEEELIRVGNLIHIARLLDLRKSATTGVDAGEHIRRARTSVAKCRTRPRCPVRKDLIVRGTPLADCGVQLSQQRHQPGCRSRRAPVTSRTGRLIQDDPPRVRSPSDQ